MATERFESNLDEYRREYALSIGELRPLMPQVQFSHQDLSVADYESFLAGTLPWHETIAKRRDHKKKLELFISHHLLGDRVGRRYLDAAGGGFSYAGTIDAQRSVLQDMEIRDTVKARVGSHVEYIESSLSEIPLPDGSIDAISVHHAFEHFQGTADIDFIREAQRILASGGRMVIIPLFLSREPLEITNVQTFDNWSIAERYQYFDPDASLPGKKSGNFARVYSVSTFRERILSNLDLDRFSVSIIELSLERRPIPDPEVYKDHRISNFNYPYRAFVVTNLR
ncbi:MAG: methyltransferase domain-containing protein [Rhizobiaceae bacterium]|nr:methyltransferase domain-containing protein [Rhizobiaceae bacterium]